MKRFVITGTGRSGTKWCATVLRLAGIQCGHEQVFTTSQLTNMDRQNWRQFEGDSSLAAVPFLDRWPEIRKVLVVRHPLDVAASFIHNGPLTENGQPKGLMDYLYRHHPEIPKAESEIEAALRYWLTWNMRAFTFADTTVRLEELDDPLKLLDAVNLTPRWPLYPFDEPVNSSDADPDVAWSELKHVPNEVLGPVGQLARKLGYDVPW